MKMFSPTEATIVVGLTSGHTCAIPPLSEENPIGVEVEPRFRREAIVKGASFEGDAQLPPKEKVATRGELIRAALEKMLDGNDPAEFKRDGTPDLKSVIRRVGFMVKREECDAAWAALKNGKPGVEDDHGDNDD